MTAGECKIDGCHEPEASSSGEYARLCIGHRNERVRSRQIRSQAASVPSERPAQARKVARLATKAARARDAYVSAEREYREELANLTRMGGTL